MSRNFLGKNLSNNVSDYRLPRNQLLLFADVNIDEETLESFLSIILSPLLPPGPDRVFQKCLLNE